MSSIETVNLLFRFATIGLQFVLFVQLARDLRLRPFKPLFMGLILCGAVYVAVSSGVLFRFFPSFILSIVPLTFFIPWLFWTSTLSLFEDEFSLGPLHWIVLGVFFTLSCVEFFFSVRVSGVPQGWLPPMMDLAGLSLIGHGLFVAWRGREGDLMEARRSFRLLFVGLVGVLIAVIIATEMSLTFFGVNDPSSEIQLLAGVSIWAIVTVLGLQLMSLREDSLLATLAAPVAVVEQSGIDPADQALYRKLQSVMTEGEVFRTEGLTIGALAEKLGTPEHQLRKLINQAMGYKNFNAYLNQFRIAAAQDQLSDLEQARKQVLTIALDAGYASLGPFNRAFKEATGQTPTEFRKQALQKAARATEELS